MHSQPAVIVLAAGRSARFDGQGNKLMQNLGPLSVLGTTVSHALATDLPVVLVTTPFMQVVMEAGTRSMPIQEKSTNLFALQSDPMPILFSRNCQSDHPPNY